MAELFTSSGVGSFQRAPNAVRATGKAFHSKALPQPSANDLRLSPATRLSPLVFVYYIVPPFWEHVRTHFGSTSLLRMMLVGIWLGFYWVLFAFITAVFAAATTQGPKQASRACGRAKQYKHNNPKKNKKQKTKDKNVQISHRMAVSSGYRQCLVDTGSV